MITTALWMHLLATGQIGFSNLWIATVIFDLICAYLIGGSQTINIRK